MRGVALTWCWLGAAAGAATHAATGDCPETWLQLPPRLPQEFRELLGNSVKRMLNKTTGASSGMLHLPGAGVMQVHYGGEVVASAFAGHLDPPGSPRLAPDETTIFRMGSVTKLFPVVMLYQLYEQGVVQSMDDPITKYEPRFRPINVYSDSKWQVTLRQLASQLSGLPREVPCTFFDCNVSTAEILRRWNETPGALWPENTEASYSNFAYSLLGNVLASLVGTTFERYVKRHILDPLGMNETGFGLSEELRGRMAFSYADGTRVPLYELGWDAPSGQAYSSARDMAKFCQFLLGLRGSHVLDGGLRREMLLPGFLFRDGRFLTGSPWEIQFFEESRWMVLGKGGGVPGYSAMLSVIPPLNLTLVGFWSGANLRTDHVSEQLFGEVLPELVRAIGPQRPQVALPSAPSRYIGTYRTGAGYGAREMRVENASLPGGGWGLRLAVPVRSMAMWLDFRSERQAVVGSVSGPPVPCSMRMIYGTEREWVTFALGEGGAVESLEMPGMRWGAKYRLVPLGEEEARGGGGGARRPSLRR